MDQKGLQRKAAEVEQLLGSQLHARGPDLARRLKKIRRLLPRNVRREISFLADAEKISHNPKLLKLIDWPRVDRAHKVAMTWLQGVDPNARRRDYLWSALGGVGLAVLVVGGLLIWILAWRGHI